MDDVVVKGGGELEQNKRYIIRSRPFDASYLEAIPNKEGDWIYKPKSAQPEDSALQNCSKCENGRHIPLIELIRLYAKACYDAGVHEREPDYVKYQNEMDALWEQLEEKCLILDLIENL